MRSFRPLTCAVLLIVMSIFLVSTAQADVVLPPGTVLPSGTSDILQVTRGGSTQPKIIAEQPGEAVTEGIDFTFPTGTSSFDQNNFTSDFVYLIEPDKPFTVNGDGTVTGIESDAIQFKVSHETGHDTTTVSFTINSDEDPDRGDTRTGFLETGTLQPITSALLGNSLNGTGHTAPVLVDSDVEAPPVGAGVPEPVTMFFLGSGLLGLAAYARKKFKKE